MYIIYYIYLYYNYVYFFYIDKFCMLYTVILYCFFVLFSLKSFRHRRLKRYIIFFFIIK